MAIPTGPLAAQPGPEAPQPAGMTAATDRAPAERVSYHVRTLVRHRWWAVAGFLVLSAPIAAVTLTTIPVYVAVTRLVVSDDRPPRVGLTDRDAAGPDRSAQTDPRSLRDVVRSRALVRETIETLRLWEAPEFGAGSSSRTTLGQAWDRYMATPTASAPADAERAQHLVDAFLVRLAVDVVVDSRLMSISFEARDPALAARAANELATRYIERDRESRLQAASDTAAWLTERLSEQRTQVATSETALQRYRESQDAISLEDRQNIVVQKLGELNTAVTRAKTDRITRETQYRQLEAIGDDTAVLETHPLIAVNAFVQTLKGQAAELSRQSAQLSEQYGPRHPEMITVRTALEAVQAKLRAEVAKVVEGVRSEYLAALSQEQSLTQALDAQKAEALALARKGVEYAALDREAASARQVFDALLQQTKEAALSSELQRSAVRIVDPAEPPVVPVRPQRGKGLLAALALGLLGGLGAAFGREYLRTTVRSPTDIERYLQLPVLALIPSTGDREVERIGELPPLAAEAFRRLRTSVMLSSDGSPLAQVIVVTSTAPREGKTVVAAQLAATLAAAEQRVVLVDADLRRPRLHTLFDRERAPGLTDVLLEHCSTAEVLPVGMPGPALIPSGLPTSRPSELLSRHSFKTFVEALRNHFDWVIIDSPPIMAVTDAAILAREATAVLFVTAAERTSLEAAETALADLTSAGARLIGAVLNRVPLTREAYYYSRYYRPEYAPYMQVEGFEGFVGHDRRQTADARARPAASANRSRLGQSADTSP